MSPAILAAVESRANAQKAVEAAGLINVVKHVPVPGSDKSPVTQRWV